MMSNIVPYDKIESVSLEEDLDLGVGVTDFGSSKLSSGNFKNEVFGNYKISSYNDLDTYIAVRYNRGNVLAFNLESTESALNLYQ
ncbi:MAG TPA: hypothetical protein HA366_02740 [Candidatus Methanomethylophilaceae archaeon]|nr:hypothetical protein [Candidatus Methanomethylophilaceae archaeon]